MRASRQVRESGAVDARRVLEAIELTGEPVTAGAAIELRGQRGGCREAAG